MKTQVILPTFPLGLPAVGLLAALLAPLAGCADDDKDAPAIATPAPTTPSGGAAAPATPPVTAATPEAKPGEAPLYLIATAVTDAEGSNTYVKTLPSLAPTGGPLALGDAREFAGWSDVQVIGGKAYVSSAEEGKILRFSFGPTGALVDDGVISFASYGANAAIYEQHFVSATKAYVPGSDRWVVWNPSTMEITGTIPYPPIETRRGIQPHYAYDRGGVRRGKFLYIPVSWLDSDDFRIEPDSIIAVFDTETDTVAKLIKAPCPFLEMGTQDEAGNLYFSSWTYQPAATVALGVAKGCAVKIPAGQEEIDPAWTLPIAEATGGHEGSALHAIGNGKALMVVFHEEKTPYVAGQTKITEFAFGPNWTFAILDLTTRKVTRELTEFGFHKGSYYAPVIDGQTVLLTPQPNAAGPNGTTYYALSPDGTLTRGLEMAGWSTRAYRVR